MPPKPLVDSAATLVAKIGELAFEGVQHLQKEVIKWKDAKRVKTIKEINAIHQKHFKDLVVILENSKQEYRLPPIFEEITKSTNDVNPQKEEEKVDYNTFELNDHIRNNAKNQTSSSDSQGMHNFHMQIKEAINITLSYDDERRKKLGRSENDEDDTTANVICYILLMLSEHCLKFSGRFEDIIYVRKLASFINAFASLHPKKEASSRFAQLKKLYHQIKKAEKTLSNHLKMVYPIKLITQLNQQCTHVITELMRCYVKLLMSSEHKNHIDKALPTYILEGYITSDVYKKSNIPLPDIIFSDWIKQCAHDYISAIATDNQEVLSLKHQFTYPLYNEFSKQAPDEVKKIQDFFNKNIYISKYTRYKEQIAAQTAIQTKNRSDSASIINNLKSPINRRLSTFALNSPAEINLNKQLQIGHRFDMNMQIFYSFASLINQLISLSYFSNQLDNCIRIQGEKYLKNPLNSDFIFSVLDGLSKGVSYRTTDLIKLFSSIQGSLEADMLSDEKMALLEDTQELLAKIHNPLLGFSQMLYNAHMQNIGCLNTKDDKLIIYIEKGDALERFAKLKEDYKVRTRVTVSFGPKPIETNVTNNTALVNTQDVAKPTHTFQKSVSAVTQHKNELSPTNQTPNLSPKSKNKPSLKKQTSFSSHNKAARLISNKTTTIAPTNKQTTTKNRRGSIQEHTLDSEINILIANITNLDEKIIYESLFDGLIELGFHADAMKDSDNKSRKHKGAKTARLIKDLKKSLNAHLSIPSNTKRQNDLGQFCRYVKHTFNSEPNKFLDKHDSTFSKIKKSLFEILASLLSLSAYYFTHRSIMFSTKSRIITHNILDELEKNKASYTKAKLQKI